MRLVYNEGQPISVSLEEGNGIFIQNGGSVEESIFIKRENGNLLVSGPMNCNEQNYLVHMKGWQPITKKKDA